MLDPCTQCEDQLLDWESLDVEQRRNVQRHVNSCPRCAERAQAFRSLDAALAVQLTLSSSGPAFRARVYQRIEAEPQPRRFWLPELLDFTAGASVIAGLVGLVAYLVPSIEATLGVGSIAVLGIMTVGLWQRQRILRELR